MIMYLLEYSEMTDDDKTLTNKKGDLVYNAAGIGQMMCTVDFLYKCANDKDQIQLLSSK